MTEESEFNKVGAWILNQAKPAAKQLLLEAGAMQPGSKAKMPAKMKTDSSVIFGIYLREFPKHISVRYSEVLAFQQ